MVSVDYKSSTCLSCHSALRPFQTECVSSRCDCSQDGEGSCHQKIRMLSLFLRSVGSRLLHGLHHFFPGKASAYAVDTMVPGSSTAAAAAIGAAALHALLGLYFTTPSFSMK